MTGNACLALGKVSPATSQNAPKCGFILAAYISKNQIYQNKTLQLFCKSRPTVSFEPCIRQKLDNT